MKKFFYKIKNAAAYFLWESEKPFFSVIFIIIICFTIFSFIGLFAIYDSTGVFFKKSDYENSYPMFEPKKIDVTFKDNGQMVIKKRGYFDLDLNKLSFVDKYYSGEYRIIFPGDYNGYFENYIFNVDNDFIKSVFVSKDNTGNTVLDIKENDIFAIDVFENKNETTISFKNPKEVYDKIIVLDPGHGGMDFGVNDGNDMEKDINLKICQKIERMFENNHKVKVYLTRNFDDYLKDEERVFFANQYADFLLSVHVRSKDQYNFLNNTKISYFEDSAAEFTVSLKKYAEILKNNILKCRCTNNAEVFNENKAELKNTEVPSIFCELGYSHEYIGVKDFSDKAAFGLYEGLNEILFN